MRGEPYNKLAGNYAENADSEVMEVGMALTEEEKSKRCVSCGRCCQFVIFMTPKPPPFPKEPIIELRDYFSARGFQITREKEKWFYIKVPMPCPHLRTKYDRWERPAYSCDIYGFHPNLCKIFDGRLVDKTDGLDCAWKEEPVKIIDTKEEKRNERQESI